MVCYLQFIYAMEYWLYIFNLPFRFYLWNSIWVCKITVSNISCLFYSVNNMLTFLRSTPCGPMTLSNMCFPTCESTALRGSSNKYKSALLYTALARLIRCFCPPLRFIPCETTSLITRHKGSNRTTHYNMYCIYGVSNLKHLLCPLILLLSEPYSSPSNPSCLMSWIMPR